MIGLRERPLLAPEAARQTPIDDRSVTIARRPQAAARVAERRSSDRWPEGRQPALPVIAPGQLWIVEASHSPAELLPFEFDAFTAANVVIYDRALTPLVAAALPLGSYAEAAKAMHQALDGPELERILRLALDGWSVLRLLDGALDAADRTDRLRRIAAHLRDAGIAAELPVHLVRDTGGECETTETSLGDLAGALDPGHCEPRVTAVFATRRGGSALPLRAVVDNGLAG
jgi:hypothetical protein